MPGLAPPSRAQRREQDKHDRQRRNRRVGAVVAGLAVLAAAVLFVVIRGSGSGPQNGPPGRSQQTLALTVSPMHAESLVSALLGADSSDNSGAVVLLPSRWLLDAAGAGPVYYGDTPTLGKNVPAESLSSALGITVDGSWSLTPSGLAGLVDEVGGVDVTVDTDVVVSKPSGTREVLLTSGPQHLTGPEAAVYATYLRSGEPEAARLARFDQVFEGVLSGLPTGSADVVPLLDRLGDASRATVSTSQLAGTLAALASATQADNTISQTLPTHTVDTGGGHPAYVLDSAAAATLVNGSFGNSKPTSGAPRVRVLVQNGVGTPGLGESAYRQLRAAGFAFVPGGNANHFGYPKTLVLIPDASPQSIQDGHDVAHALGVPTTAVKINGHGLTIADIVVVLGRDYKP